MARRRRRRRFSPSKANPRSYSELRTRTELEPASTQPVVASSVAEDSNRSSQTASTTSRQDEGDWKTEYGRVFSDLKQLLVVSVALFGVMLVVGYLL